MIQRFKTFFLLKKPGSYKSGPLPIYLRITINGKRAEASIQRTREAAKRDQKKGRAIGLKGEAIVLNNYLGVIQGDVFVIQKQYALQAITPTPNQFFKALFRHEENVNPRILEVFQSHNVQFEKLVGKEFSSGTLKKFNTALRHLKDFITWKHNTNDLDLRLINNLFIKDYEFYLKSVAVLQHNTAMSNIKKLKKIIRQCVANEWIETDPFKSYKITTKETHRVFLMNEELDKLRSKSFSNNRLDQVKDIFLFSCYTGIAYSDVIKLTPSDVSIGIDGEQWIFTNRTKTGTQSRIPLLPVAKGIIEKYGRVPKVVASGNWFQT